MGSGGSVQQIHVTKDDLKKGRIEINRSVSAPNTKKTKKKNDFVGGASTSREHKNTALERQKTVVAANDLPQYGEDDELVMETFYHMSGPSYSCLFQQGSRFYLDSWQSGDWVPFPSDWYKQGILVTEQVLKKDPTSGEFVAKDGGEERSKGGNAPEAKDDREGVIEIGEKKIPTYIFEEKRNVHYYFDDMSGSWIKLPIALELRSEFVTNLIANVEEQLPQWKDRHDILAALRNSNYDAYDCIGTFLACEGLGEIDSVRSSEDAKVLAEKNERIKELEDKLKKVKKRLQKNEAALKEEKEDHAQSKSLIATLKDQVSEAQVAVATQGALADAARNRPKTGATRNPSRTPSPMYSTEKNNHVPQSSIDPKTLNDLRNNFKELHKGYLTLKLDTKQSIDELKKILTTTGVAVTRLQLRDSTIESELSNLKDLYRKECLQRKMLYNKLQELRGNIRVFARVRYDAEEECMLDFPNDREIHMSDSGKKYKFDRVFNPQSTQEEVFEEARSIITSCVDGYNVCILAYGQTGSGKTHTMMGPLKDPGVNVRALKELLNVCQERTNVSFTLKASMVEIYNETIMDLLCDTADIREIRSKGNKIVVPDITEMFVETIRDIDDVMEQGQKNRHVASTKMNSTSSRSHLILMITVEAKDQASGTVTTGTLTLCDLAGSERVGKTEATGQRLVEAAAINKSLSSLGQVFTALKTGQLHVPYRNSKLTHILQPSLGGDAKAIVLVCARYDYEELRETGRSFDFGHDVTQDAEGSRKKKPGPPSQHSAAWRIEDDEDGFFS